MKIPTRHRNRLAQVFTRIGVLVLASVCVGEDASPRLPDWLEIHGELRIRFEWFDGEDFDDRRHDAVDLNNFGVNDNVIGENDEWILTRLRLRVDAYPIDRVHLVAEMADARLFEDQYHRSEYPGTRHNWEQDTLDLYQGYADFKLNAGLHLIIGRQTLRYGSQKFIGEYDWWNVPFSFDAVRLSMRRVNWDLDIFVAQNAVNDDHNFNDSDDDYSNPSPFTSFTGFFDDNTMAGIYWTSTRPSPHRLDLFSFLRDNDNEKSRVYTIGARIYGATTRSWDYDLEVMIQPGEQRRNEDHFAWTASTEWGYVFQEIEKSPRIYLCYDVASGDEDVDDNENEEFDVTFADDYNQLGRQEFFMRRNLQAARIGAESRLTNRVKASLEWLNFWVIQDDDIWLGRYHTFVRPRSGRDADNYIGSELDFILEYPIVIRGRVVDALFRYSHFFPGAFVKDANGAADDAFEMALMFTFCF